MQTTSLLNLLAALFIQCSLAAQNYTSYLTGDPADIEAQPQPGIVLAGGAGDNDEAMAWFLSRASGGDVVVIRASGSDGYNNYFYSQLGVQVNSVETIVFNNASAANETYVIEQLMNAEAIFIAGGNQWNYVQYWRNTPVEDALNNLIHVKGGVIGGTSAGMAILGGHYFSAQNGTVTSSEALSNPYNFYMQLGHHDFLDIDILKYTITDTHYDNPDRRGRHTAFLARLLHEGNWPSTGIACNEYCAVCIDENGIAHAFGEYPQYQDFVYFLRPNCTEPVGPEVCTSGQPLTWNRNEAALKVLRVPATTSGTNTFDLNDWISQSGQGQWQEWWVEQGVIHFDENQPAPDCSITHITSGHSPQALIYPNPVSDVLHIQSDKTLAQLTVSDLYGRQMLTEKVSGTAVALATPTLPAGLYILAITSDDRSYAVQLFQKN